MSYIKLLLLGISNKMSLIELKHVLNKFGFKPATTELVPNTSSTDNQPTFQLYLQYKKIGLKHKFPSANSLGISEYDIWYNRANSLANYCDQAINIMPSKSIETLKAMNLRRKKVYEYKLGEDFIIAQKTEVRPDLYIDLERTSNYEISEVDTMNRAFDFIYSNEPLYNIIKVISDTYEKGKVVQVVAKGKKDFLARAIKYLIVNDGQFTSKTKAVLNLGNGKEGRYETTLSNDNVNASH